MKNRVTIKTIAKELGMSHMTVSRALANSSKVQEKTREAIQTRAAELGYVPNHAALAMRGGATGVIGLLVPSIENEFYASFANQLSMVCAEQNLQLMIGLTQDDPAAEVSALTRLLKYQVTSVILVPTPNSTAEISAATSRLLTGVNTLQLIRHRSDITDASQLLIEESVAFAKAAEVLCDSGCKRIAYIGGSHHVSTGRSRFEATIRALKKVNLELDPGLIKTGTPSSALGEGAMLELMALTSPPDAVITAGFEISNGAIKACLVNNIRIPDQVHLVGYGDPSWYQWVYGGITTISLPIADMAIQSLAILTDKQRNDSPHSTTGIVVSSHLVRRHSA